MTNSYIIIEDNDVIFIQPPYDIEDAIRWTNSDVIVDFD